MIGSSTEVPPEKKIYSGHLCASPLTQSDTHLELASSCAVLLLARVQECHLHHLLARLPCRVKLPEKKVLHVHVAFLYSHFFEGISKNYDDFLKMEIFTCRSLQGHVG